MSSLMNTCCSVVNLAFLLHCLECWNCLPVDLSAPPWLSLCLYEKVQTLQHGVQGLLGLDTTLLPSSILSLVPWPALLASMFLIKVHHPFPSTCMDWITISLWPLHQQNWKLLQVHHPFPSTPRGPDYSSTPTTSPENTLGLFHLLFLVLIKVSGSFW